jgi:hypothetical protein
MLGFLTVSSALYGLHSGTFLCFVIGVVALAAYLIFEKK